MCLHVEGTARGGAGRPGRVESKQVTEVYSRPSSMFPRAWKARSREKRAETVPVKRFSSTDLRNGANAIAPSHSRSSLLEIQRYNESVCGERGAQNLQRGQLADDIGKVPAELVVV